MKILLRKKSEKDRAESFPALRAALFGRNPIKFSLSYQRKQFFPQKKCSRLSIQKD